MVDEVCGKDIGIFKVLYLCDKRANDGHKKYHIKCNYGIVKSGKEWSKHLGLGKNGIEDTIMFIKERI